MPAADTDGAERRLMDRIAAGDPLAADRLFLEHGDVVYRFLRGSGVAAAEAEDITQDVFVRAITGATSFRGSGSLTAWLLGIARNQRVDRARAERSRAERETAWAREAETATESTPEEGALLRRLLRGLDEDDREIIVLARFLELPAARVAEILDITPGAARVRLHRAVARLAELYRSAGGAT